VRGTANDPAVERNYRLNQKRVLFDLFPKATAQRRKEDANQQLYRQGDGVGFPGDLNAA